MSFFRFEHRAMACRWELWLPSDGRPPAERGSLAAWIAEEFEELDRLESELSRFIESSDVSRIRELRGGQAMPVGIDMARCLEFALEAHELTEGAFDVSLGSGLSSLLVDRERRSVCVESDEPLTIDLGGIAKGYALDLFADSIASTLIDEEEFSGALIHGGQSSVRAIGNQPDGSPWSIPLRNPGGESGASFPDPTVILVDAVLSGSAGELKRGHVIDPRRRGQSPGRQSPGEHKAPLSNRATWVVASSGAWSDVLSTACFVLGRAGADALWPRVREAVPGVRGFVWEDGVFSELGGSSDDG